MDKLKVYKELRLQLAVEYEREINAVRDLLENGIQHIGGAETQLSVVSDDRAGTLSETRQRLHEDIDNTLQLLLRRYAKCLEEEVYSLGLNKFEAEAVLSRSLEEALSELLDARNRQTSDRGRAARSRDPATALSQPLSAEEMRERLAARRPTVVVSEDPSNSAPEPDSKGHSAAPGPVDGETSAETAASEPSRQLDPDIEELLVSNSGD